MPWETITTEEATHRKNNAANILKAEGYDVDEMTAPDQCECCVESQFDLYSNVRAMRAWNDYRNYMFLGGYD